MLLICRHTFFLTRSGSILAGRINYSSRMLAMISRSANAFYTQQWDSFPQKVTSNDDYDPLLFPEICTFAASGVGGALLRLSGERHPPRQAEKVDL